MLGGQNLFNSLPRLAINFTLGRFEEYDQKSFSSNHPGAIYPIFQIFLVQNSYCVKELNHFSLLSSSDDICLLFWMYPSYMTVLITFFFFFFYLFMGFLLYYLCSITV